MIPNRFLLLFLFSFLSHSIFAQIYFGLEGGINRSKSTYFFNIDPNVVTDAGDLDGFYFSLPLEIKGNEFFDFLPSFVFASEGSVLSVQTVEESRTYSNALLYLKLPLLAKLKVLKKKNYEFGIVAGVIPAYAIDIKSYYYTFPEIRTSIDSPVDFQEAGIRRFDLAMSLGLNTEKTIAKGWKIVLEARYNIGMLDIETHSELTTSTESFSLALGLLTPLFNQQKKLDIAY